jgi:RimJ/RimL family protein N-acetyltransferase
MSDKEKAVKMIYESIKDRLNMSFDDFYVAMQDWEITPLKQNSEIIGGVLAKGNEIHVGYGIKPPASIKKHIKETLKRIIDQYGNAVTSVMEENQRGINFCKRLGFIEFKREHSKIYLKCDRCVYV